MEPQDASKGESRLNRVGGIEIPQGALAHEAYETAIILVPELLVRHSQRTFVFASIAGNRSSSPFDAELLYVAAMFMNVGLNAAYANSQRRYEVDSANAVRQLLAGHHVTDSIAVEVWYAVALHTTHCIPNHMSPLASLIAAGVRTDLFGHNVSAISRETRADILRAYPRGQHFKERFIESIGEGVAHRPNSTFGSVAADVLERQDPDFRRLNYCGLILGSNWKD